MNQPAKSDLACPRCRTTVSRNNVYCPKCAVLLPEKELEKGGETKAAPAVDNPHIFSLSSLLLITTGIAIYLALFAAAPGLGIFLAVISIPAWIRTILVINRRKSLGRVDGANTKIGLFLGSLGVSILLVFVVQIAALVALVISCMGALVVFSRLEPPNGSETLLVFIMGGFTLTVVVLVIAAFSTWIRARWRHDTFQD